MPMRIRQSAAMVVMVMALFLVGNTANAGWLDWLWPFGSQPQEQTPSADAQMPPGGSGPGMGTTTMGPGPGDQGGQPGGQPNTGMMGQQNQPGQGFNQPGMGTQNQQGQPNQPGMNPQDQQNRPDMNFQQGQMNQQGQQNQPGMQPGQQGQQGQQNQNNDPRNSPDWKPGPGDKFFCNSLGREASRPECDAADREKGFKPGQQGQEDMKPPFPGTEQQQMKTEDTDRYRKESEESRRQVEEKMRQDNKMRQPQQNEQMQFPGQGKNEGEFPGQGATKGNFPGGQEGQRGVMDQGQQNQQFNFDQQQEQPRQVLIDPQFVKQVTREIADQTRELNRMLKAAKKLAGAETAVAKVQGLLDKVNEFKTKIKSVQGEELQEAIDDFHNEQIWDSLNGIRAIVELPKQLKDMDRSITKVEKLFKNKAVQRLADWGVDLARMQTDVAAIREKVTSVKALLSAGSGEEAQEAMQDVWEEGFHPGEIEGTLQQMRGMTDNLRRIRNKEVQAMVKEVFQPVIDAINDGDYREANQLMNELQFEMQRVFAQLYRLGTKSKLSNDLKSKLDAFEARIQEKLESGNNNEAMPSTPAVPQEGF